MPERKPLLNSSAAQEFIRGNSPSSAVSAPPAGKAKKRDLPVLKEKEATTRLTVDLPVSQHKRLKLAAVEAGVPMTELVRHALLQWLNSQS